ncbi:beta-1,3-galactosyltransferase pvg3-like [Typha latifolia]|uniref:beta-1,3-galactosyltransferase pvg3-like n=1 Tax=Typha latifolia TaxID=4733 RepID=UPI003C30840A
MKSSNPSPLTIALFLLPTILLLLTLFVIFPNESKLRSTTASSANCRPSPRAAFTDLISVKPDVRLLVGVLTLPENYARRNLVRLAYAHQPNHTGHVDVRFVFCNLPTEEQRVLVALEIMEYNDIIVLNCTENMDNGKTYTFFSSLPMISDVPYDYVMKTDDDTYVRLRNLVDALKSLPRENLYFGLMVPCLGISTKYNYMSGLGYIVSWDLVEWIATSELARTHTTGPEDLVTGKWFKDGGRAVHMYDATPAMYDYFELPYTCFRHEFVPETIAVHKLKSNERWARTLKYFNVTLGLKPTKLYPFP